MFKNPVTTTAQPNPKAIRGIRPFAWFDRDFDLAYILYLFFWYSRILHGSTDLKVT
jgi:hypothetical protein